MPIEDNELGAIQAQARRAIETALRESRVRVSGPSGAAAKLGDSAIDVGIEDSALENRQESLQKLDRRISPGWIFNHVFIR